jgi:predicted glutamine amidotransferase
MAGHHAVLVASEPITDEAWSAIEEGALLRIDRSPEPEPRFLFRQARESLR